MFPIYPKKAVIQNHQSPSTLHQYSQNTLNPPKRRLKPSKTMPNIPKLPQSSYETPPDLAVWIKLVVTSYTV